LENNYRVGRRYPHIRLDCVDYMAFPLDPGWKLYLLTTHMDILLDALRRKKQKKKKKRTKQIRKQKKRKGKKRKKTKWKTEMG